MLFQLNSGRGSDARPITCSGISELKQALRYMLEDLVVRDIEFNLNDCPGTNLPHQVLILPGQIPVGHVDTIND